MINREVYLRITKEISGKDVTLVAVSKTKPISEIQDLYDLGQRDFGENYVQELVEKQPRLPHDIRWHFIGHLQSNKVKYIAPFVHLIHSIDNEKLLKEVNRQAAKNNRIIDCLLQIHIASEDTKFGMGEDEASLIINKVQSGDAEFKQVGLKGLMGMASNTQDDNKIREEYRGLDKLYEQLSVLPAGHSRFSILSMGMSGDYKIAIEEGSNIVRIGSLLFGARSYPER